MVDVTITNGEVLATAFALKHARATNALASAKLAKLRKAINAEADVLQTSIDEAAKRHATNDDAGAPKVRQQEGQPLYLKLTGTPAYEMAPEGVQAFDAELAPLLADKATLSVIPLSEGDLAAILIAEDIGEALLPFISLN